MSLFFGRGFSLVVGRKHYVWEKPIVSTKTVGPVELLGSIPSNGVLADNDDESLYNAIKLFVQ